MFTSGGRFRPVRFDTPAMAEGEAANLPTVALDRNEAAIRVRAGRDRPKGKAKRVFRRLADGTLE
jgi:hypothetical protein